MSSKDLTQKLRAALRKREIDVTHVRHLIRKIQTRERLGAWLSVAVSMLLVVGLVAGVIFSISEVIAGV